MSAVVFDVLRQDGSLDIRFERGSDGFEVARKLLITEIGAFEMVHCEKTLAKKRGIGDEILEIMQRRSKLRVVEEHFVTGVAILTVFCYEVAARIMDDVAEREVLKIA